MSKNLKWPQEPVPYKELQRSEVLLYAAIDGLLIKAYDRGTINGITARKIIAYLRYLGFIAP